MAHAMANQSLLTSRLLNHSKQLQCLDELLPLISHRFNDYKPRAFKPEDAVPYEKSRKWSMDEKHRQALSGKSEELSQHVTLGCDYPIESAIVHLCNNIKLTLYCKALQPSDIAWLSLELREDNVLMCKCKVNYP